MTETVLTTAEETTETTVTNAIDSITEQVDKASGIFSSIVAYIKSALPSLIVAAVILLIGVLISKLVAHFTKKALSRSKVDGAARSFLVSLIKIIIYMVVIIMALSVLNVPMSSIITILGAAGLAISLAFQNVLSNLCGGFIILFSKPFSSGDIIEIDGSVGTVRDISILYTTIITFDNKTVFIPNGKVSDAKIINYTETPMRRIDLCFSISYKADYEKARTAVLSLIGTEPMLLKDPAPIVRMSAHNESSVAIDVLVWVKNPDYIPGRYALVEGVKRIFDENGIEIPFNQLDVHIKDSAE